MYWAHVFQHLVPPAITTRTKTRTEWIHSFHWNKSDYFVFFGKPIKRKWLTLIWEKSFYSGQIWCHQQKIILPIGCELHTPNGQNYHFAQLNESKPFNCQTQNSFENTWTQKQRTRSRASVRKFEISMSDKCLTTRQFEFRCINISKKKKARAKRPSSTALATIQITHLAPDDIRKIWSDVPKCLRLFTKIDCLEPQTVMQCLWQSNNDRRKNGWKLNYLWRCHYPCFPNDRTLLNKIN